MRQMTFSKPENKWLVFRSAKGRNAAAAYYRRRGWYVFLWQDVQGPSLHAARHWHTSPGSRELVGI